MQGGALSCLLNGTEVQPHPPWRAKMSPSLGLSPAARKARSPWHPLSTLDFL